MLILAHNYLKHIPAKVFRHLPLLNSLELDGNQISHIDEEAFFGLEGKYLNFEHNVLGMYIFLWPHWSSKIMSVNNYIIYKFNQ